MQNILEYDEFIRSIKQNKKLEHSILLGAGASIESGVPSAIDCIWEWKKDIFLSQNPYITEQYRNVKIVSVQNAIQKWLDNQGIYPKSNDENEYSYYAEKAYRISSDRRRYFQSITFDKSPSLGYNLISLFSKYGMIRSVWTTNFDGLMVKSAYQNNITPIEVTLESQERIYRNNDSNELLCIALHGDYKYGALKNTSSELDVQDETLISGLTHELTTRNFIVIGYSGRDKSLMESIKAAYKVKGPGRLYWCGYGRNINNNVSELINEINSFGREAFYIPTQGFDNTMFNLSLACFENEPQLFEAINKMKNQFTPIKKTFAKFDCHQSNYNKVIKSNLLPIAFPKYCYQFQLSYQANEKPWTVCKELRHNNILAVPYKDMVYAFGMKEDIISTCGSRLKSDIGVTPITRDSIIEITALKELVLKTITNILSDKNALECNGKNKIWNINSVFTSVIKNKSVKAYEGIELSIVFDNNNTYITIIPSYHFETNEVVDKDVIKEFSKAFNMYVNGQKPNLNYHNYINKWISMFFNNKVIKAEYPINSKSGFVFTFSPNTLYVGLESNTNLSKLNLPLQIKEKQVVLKGIEYPDPKLQFYNATQKRMTTDYHPMRGLKNNQPYDYFMNNEVFKPFINIGIICPEKYNGSFSNFMNSLNQSHSTKYNVDYVIDYPGFTSVYGIALNIPVPGDPTWVDFSIKDKDDIKETALNLGKQLTRFVEQMNAQQNVDVIVIYIPEEYEYYTSFKDNNVYFDLHDFVKAFSVQKNISTQFIRQKTLMSSLDCQIAWSLSLAFYVKALRTPWVLTNLRNDTAFAGIGYSINHHMEGSKIVVGCSHIYSSDGQGMKYKLSKITDITFDKKKNPYLSENEAFQLGLNIKELFFKSFSELPKRVVVHKRTPFMAQEIKGLINSLTGSGIEEIDLVEISYEDSARFFELDKNFNIDSFPVRRGCCFPISDNIAFLYTHGIAPSVRNPYYRYIQGGKSIPVPLKITKHYGNGDLSQIATEILGLSKMNWNSFELYSKLPCTIESSSIISKIGWLLSQYDGTVYDYRNFM